MSDNKKPEKPLESPEFAVSVIPKDKTNPDHQKTAENVQKKLKENVKRAIDENKSGGKTKQFEAAEKEIKKAGQGTDPVKIDKIKIHVAGKDEDGDLAERKLSVTPKEDKKTS